MKITGIDVGTRNLSVCTLEVLKPYTTPGQWPSFRIHEWKSIDLGGKRVQDNVDALCCLFLAGGVDLNFADQFVIELQLGGKFGNPTMKAVSHVLQTLIVSHRKDTSVVSFRNSKMKFSAFPLEYPHTKQSKACNAHSKKGLMTKENAIHLVNALLENNDAYPQYVEQFNDPNITKHKRKDLSDSLGIALTHCALSS
jgi:hypothetical protein